MALQSCAVKAKIKKNMKRRRKIPWHQCIGGGGALTASNLTDFFLTRSWILCFEHVLVQATCCTYLLYTAYTTCTHPSTPRVVRGIQAAGALEVVNWNTWEFCTPYQNCVTYSFGSFSHWTASWDIEQPLGQASNLDILKKKPKRCPKIITQGKNSRFLTERSNTVE